MTASAVLSAIRNVVDPLAVNFKESYANRLKEASARINVQTLGGLYDVVQTAPGL
jgi:hypothetical protein